MHWMRSFNLVIVIIMIVTILGADNINIFSSPIPRINLAAQDVLSALSLFSGSHGEESLKAINADEWQTAGFKGAGVKVGILDLGFEGVEDLLGSELPAEVTTNYLCDGSGYGHDGAVHGTAVAEVIHDIAPDAELYLTNYCTDVQEQVAVEWLVDQGVKIISHSRGSLADPIDGTSYSAQLVNWAASKGILWVNSAGNNAENHFRATFTDENNNGLHEFSSGVEALAFYPFGQFTILAINWDDWINGSENYDLLILDQNGNQVVSSQNIQDGGDAAQEWIQYQFADSGPYYIVFKATQTTRPVIFDLMSYGGQLTMITPGYSLGSPADAQGSFSVGAVYWENDRLEDYSSMGPTGDGRLKPDISAPTGVSSFSFDSGFYGTSAAAPHVSAAAALVFQAFPGFTPEQVKNFLMDRSIDLGDTGPDVAFGYGRLYLGDPPSGVATLEPTTPPTSAPTLPPEVTATTGITTTPPTTEPTRTPVMVTPPQPTPVPPGSMFTDVVWILMGGVACIGGVGVLGLILLLVLFLQRKQSSGRGNQAVRSQGQLGRIAHQSICPRCGTPHVPRASSCPKCGIPFDRQPTGFQPQPACRYCGQSLRPGGKFCPRCGRPQ